jgi:uncharacterized protein (TIGR02996 family)
MTDDAAFIRAMASALDHTAISLLYADWFEERGDPRCKLLRLWSELLAISYSEETFEDIQVLAARYRQQVSQADPKWLAQVGRARVWIGRELAQKLVQVYLRVRHGRKENRQRIGFESWPFDDEWRVYYWRQPPSHKQMSWRGKSWLWVNKVSGEIRGDHHW